MEAVLARASVLHRGFNVYHSRIDCLDVLRSVETLRPQWWSPQCSDFLQLASVAKGPLQLEQAGFQERRHPIIVVEGLDGVGKTLITRSLAERLGGVAVATPPSEFSAIRSTFRNQDEAVARAFYSAANYIAAEYILRASSLSLVVVDRWWCSTCAMALANRLTVDRLPPIGSGVLKWPEDLPQMDAGYLICVDEAVRVARIRKRAPEDAEEQRLSSQLPMRLAAMEAYRRTGLLMDINAPTYRAAVNDILAALTNAGISHKATPFTQKELDEVTIV